jgi:hypothetical protein
MMQTVHGFVSGIEQDRMTIPEDVDGDTGQRVQVPVPLVVVKIDSFPPIELDGQTIVGR